MLLQGNMTYLWIPTSVYLWIADGGPKETKLARRIIQQPSRIGRLAIIP
jgi:hypothetical protein